VEKEVNHIDKIFEKIIYSETGAPGEEFDDCTFIHCNFSNSDLSGAVFVDCRMTDCDLSMVKVSQTMIRNVAFINCKVVGVDFSKCLSLLLEVNFEKCCLDYSIFTRNKLSKTTFKECVIKDADFTEADLTGACFDDCELLNTVFHRTDLSEADFRTSRNYTINLEKNRVRKAKFSYDGIGGLLRQYDILIE